MNWIQITLVAIMLGVWVLSGLIPLDLRPPNDAERAHLPFHTPWRRDD
jgi:hypothetical protein